jgi:hypothetical protein
MRLIQLPRCKPYLSLMSVAYDFRCIFRTETQDLNQYLYDVEIAANGLMYRVFGGFVLQLGGYIQLNGCEPKPICLSDQLSL